MTNQGLPCWYELMTKDRLQAQEFYSRTLGWTFEDAGMPGSSYMLARSGPDMVAGLMQPETPMPGFWMVYFVVDDCDAATKKLSKLGGAVHHDPTDIPGTGRFAVVADPQGAVFGLLQPLDGPDGGAFDPTKPGHGHWQQLETTDPAAALTFYTKLLGWVKSSTHDMGDAGPYQVVSAKGRDIGGVMKLMQGEAPPHWMPFFGTDSVAATLARAGSAGGTTLAGPDPVPGGAIMAVAQDPHGSMFGLLGAA